EIVTAAEEPLATDVEVAQVGVLQGRVAADARLGERVDIGGAGDLAQVWARDGLAPAEAQLEVVGPEARAHVGHGQRGIVVVGRGGAGRQLVGRDQDLADVGVELVRIDGYGDAREVLPAHAA